MGKWLNQLRENARTPSVAADKTDKTTSETVLSVLSGQPDVTSRIINNKELAGFVSSVGSTRERFQKSRAFDSLRAWDEEDWQSAFEERAAILEFDEGMARKDAELLAREQIRVDRKKFMQ